MLSRFVKVGVFAALLLSAESFTPAAAQQMHESLVQPFRQAETYLHDGEYERAVEALEELYDRSPSTYVFYDRLLQAYENLKQYDEAVALVDDRLEHVEGSGQAVPLLATKGRLYYLWGDEEQATSTWENALASRPDDQQTYRTVYSAMADVRNFSGAIDVLNRGRRHLDDEALFVSELAHLYGLAGQHASAIEEYLTLLRVDERRLSFVRSRLSRMFEQEGALEATLPVVERAVQEDPLARAIRELLGWMYLEDQQFAQALDAFRAVDRLEREEGQMLLQFAESARDGASFETAVVAYEEILSRHPGSAAASRALWGRGQALEKWAHELPPPEADSLYTSALEDYQTFLQNHSGHPYYADVLRHVARLQQDVFQDYDATEAHLETVLNRYPDSDAAHEALFDLGHLEIKRGNLREAQLAFSRLVDNLRTGDRAERARYELARLHFYQGEFESATTLAAVLEGNTSSPVANDAIELKLLIREHKGPDSLHTALQDYAEVRLLFRQHRLDEVLDRVDQLLENHGNHPIADRANFLKAETLQEVGRAEDAVSAYQELSRIFPYSPLADKSLFRAAELQAQYGMTEEAVDSYLQLITDFPGSLLVPDARSRVRSLQSDGA